MTRLEFTDEEFDRTRHSAEIAYAQLGQIRCPYFRDSVHFNTDGLQHLRFKGWNRTRSRHDQFMRLKHLTKAHEILRVSQTVQGVQQTKEWERRHRYGRWEKLLIEVSYYEFVAVLEGRRFKVIVKQLPDGKRIFWSLIPFWRQTKEGRRLLHDGNPSED